MGSNLITVVTSHIPDEERFKLVSDYVSEQRQWRWDCFAHWLPSSMIMNITSIKPHSLIDGEDSVYWGCSKSGLFTVKSAFSLLEGSKWNMEDGRWSAIWKWKGLDQVKMFLWLAMHDKLLTNVERVRHRLIDNDICEKCQQEKESTLHVLRDCPFATWIWPKVVQQDDWDQFFNLPFQDWLSRNLRSRESWDYPIGIGFWCDLLGPLELEE